MQQNSSLFITSLDTDSLFTNILLDKHINICTEILCKTDYIVASTIFSDNINYTHGGG